MLYVQAQVEPAAQAALAEVQAQLAAMRKQIEDDAMLLQQGLESITDSQTVYCMNAAECQTKNSAPGELLSMLTSTHRYST
jgi:hypothetical protein